jgi:hypothetical protein
MLPAHRGCAAGTLQVLGAAGKGYSPLLHIVQEVLNCTLQHSAYSRECFPARLLPSLSGGCFGCGLGLGTHGFGFGQNVGCGNFCHQQELPLHPLFKGEKKRQNQKWLHNPYLLGAPQQGDKIRIGCITILGTYTRQGRCRQVSPKILAGVGRCHKFFWQVSAGVRQFGRSTWKHTHRHNPQT